MALTLTQLLNEMRQFRNPSGTGRNPNDYPDLRLSTLEYTGWVGTKSLMFKSEVESQSKDPNRRLVNIQFYGINATVNQSSANPFRVKINNEFFYFSLPSLNSNVAMRCSCPDFFFRCAWPLADKGSLVGPRPTYVRKTANRPSVNPLNKPMMCKHIWCLLKELQRGKVLV